MTWTNLARLSLAFLHLTTLPVAMPARAQQKTVPAAGVSSGASTVQVFTGDFNPRGAWAPNTAYAVKDVVGYQGSAYVVTQAYTSSVSFASPNLALLVAGGQPGPAGRGVTGGSFNAAGHLILNMTDGTTSDAGLFPTAPAGSGTGAVAASAPSITFGTPTLDANGVTYDVSYTVTASVAGTAPITYQVEYKASAASAFILVAASGPTLSGTITGLAPSASFTGQVVASNVLGPVSSTAKTFSTPALPAAAAAYVQRTPLVPNVVFMVDANETAGTGPITGSQGIQVDAGTGNVDALKDPISGTVFTNGYGKLQLVAGTNEFGGYPVLRGNPNSFNMGYDGLKHPNPAACDVLVQSGQSFGFITPLRQTGGQSSALLSIQTPAGNDIIQAAGSDGALTAAQNNHTADTVEASSALTALGQSQLVSVLFDATQNVITIFRNGNATVGPNGGNGGVGGLGTPTVCELFNNPQGDSPYAEIFVGLPSRAQHQAELASLKLQYAIPGPIATLTAGPVNAVAPVSAAAPPAPSASAAAAPTIVLGAPIPQQDGQSWGLPYTIALASTGGVPTDIEVGLERDGLTSFTFLGNVAGTLTGVLNTLPPSTTFHVTAEASNSSNTSPAVGAAQTVTLPAALPLVGSGGGANVATAVPALPGIFAVYTDFAGANGYQAAFNSFMGFTGAAATKTALHVFSGNGSQSDYEGSLEYEDYQGLYTGPRVFSIPDAWNGPNGKTGELIPQAATGAFNGSYAKVATQLLNRMTHSNVTLPDGTKDDQTGSLDPPQAVVYIRGPWEFNQQNGASNAWASGNGGAASYAQFQQAWQQWVNTFRTTLANYVPTSTIAKPAFRFVFCPTFQGEDPMLSYPGDAYVDVIASDLYVNSQYQGGITDPDALFQNIKTQNYGLDWITSTAAAHGKMVAVPEWGLNQDNAGAYFDDFYAWAVAQGSNLAYIGYWFSDSSYIGKMSDGNYPQSGAEFKHLFNPSANPVQAIPYPVGVAAVGGNGVANISGTADPASANVTGYNLYAGPTSFGENLTTPVATSSTPNFSVPLANGSTAFYREAAVLANGNVGTLSPEVSATALAPPANAPPYAVAMGANGSASTAVPAAFQPPQSDFWKMATFTPTQADLQSGSAALIDVWGGSGYVNEAIFQLNGGTLELQLQNNNQYPTMVATVPGGMVAGHPYTAWVHYEKAAGRATFFLDPAGHTGAMTQLGAPVIGTPGFQINTAQCSYPPNQVCPAVVIGNVSGGNPNYQFTGSISEAAILDAGLNPIVNAVATASGFSDASPGTPVWALQGSATAGGTGAGSFVPLPTPLPPTPAGTFSGLPFAWANQGNATISASGTLPAVLTALSNGNAANIRAIVTPLPAGDFRAVIRIKTSSLAENYVNGGLVAIGSTGRLTSLFDILTNELALSTFDGFQGQNEQHLQGTTAEPFATGGSDFCEEMIRINGQYSFFAEGVNTTSNTCPAGGWVPFGSAQTGAALGNPVSIGIEADDIDTTGANVPLTVTLEAIQIGTGTDPQAAY